MLQALVRSQRILGAITTMAEFAHVQRVRLFVFILEVTFERVVAAEGATAVRTLLRLVDAARGGRGHPHDGACNSQRTDGARAPYTTCQQPTQKQLNITSERDRYLGGGEAKRILCRCLRAATCGTCRCASSVNSGSSTRARR